MSETNQSMAAINDDAEARVQRAMEKSFQLVSALEAEMKAFVPLDLFEEYRLKTVEALARVLAVLDASDNKAIQETLKKRANQFDAVELTDTLALDALYIWKGMKIVLEGKEKVKDRFERTSAHYIDTLLIKCESTAPLPFSLPQIIDSD
jgi:hypothetical protein